MMVPLRRPPGRQRSGAAGLTPSRPPLRHVATTLARVVGVTGAVAIWALSAAGDVRALSCIELPDVHRAAEEAIKGEHPLWAKGYMVAIVENVMEDDRGGLLSMAVRPTHVFAGEYPERLTLRARPDGPPDPRMFRPGRSYFLSLDHGPPGSGELLISPCAPNYEVTAEQVEHLVAVAPHIELRQADVPGSDDAVPVGWPLAAGIAIVAVIALGSAMIVRRG